MKAFMDENFLLETPTAQKLFHSYAEVTPVLDYHCHINPREIAEDRKFENITQVWLGGDHYKWRQMRSNGVDEYYITGGAPDREKFQKWAETLEKAVGNPLYHWSHLELQRYFGYHGVLNGRTAQEVWDICNAKLASDDMTVRNLIRRSGVTLICTTDDPVDSLEWHEKIKADESFEVQVLPAWRPDKAMNIEKPEYLDYLAELEKTSGILIDSFKSLKKALKNRMDYFEHHGCSVSDHALEYVMYEPADKEEIESIFTSRLLGADISREDELKFKTAFMLFVGKQYKKRNWVMQLHYGCKRDNNVRHYKALGPDTGVDCINNYAPSSQTADFLNALAENDKLPKTILYSLNPNDNEAIGTILGCFQNSDAIGKIQQGSAWWFNDHKVGMINQMISLGNLGLLGNFVGMLTDSRSFLSYTRHEYFRRIMCNLIGGWVENGEFTDDEITLKNLVKDISYRNAIRYFGFDLDPEEELEGPRNEYNLKKNCKCEPVAEPKAAAVAETKEKKMELLNYDVLEKSGYKGYIKKSAPEKVLQFGEGNFLRAFVDYWFDLANEEADWNGKVVLMQPIAGGLTKLINDQDALYTLYLRGSENGKTVDEKRVISSCSRCLNPYEDWDKAIAVAQSDDLEIIVSNTTEAGIVHDNESKYDQVPPVSFPAKLTVLLHKRFEAGKKGIVMLSCELIDNNGKELLNCVNQYIDDWGLSADFKKWVNEENIFCSTLVDRIVPGRIRDPKEVEKLEAENGYHDELIDVGECFGVWVIEGPEKLKEMLPFSKTPSANVEIVPDVTPYKHRKVRILNGAHTGFVLGAYLAGFDIVRDCMHDDVVKGFMNKLLQDEVIPTLKHELDEDDLKAFAAAVEDRFNNPFVNHELMSISLNSTSKWKARDLPSFLEYVDEFKELPPAFTMSLAAYIAFYSNDIQRREEKTLVCKRPAGNEYEISDDAWALDFYYERKDATAESLVHDVLTNTQMWDQDLTKIAGLEAKVVENLKMIREKGAKAAYASVL